MRGSGPFRHPGAPSARHPRRCFIDSLFSRGPSITARLILVIMLSLTMMIVDHHQSHLQTIRAGLATLIYPFQLVVDLPSSAARSLSGSLTDQGTLRREVEQLRNEKLRLHGELQRMAALEAENERLRELFESSRELDERVEIAELLSVDLDPFSRKVVLNKGGRDEVYAGQPILDRDGVMGQVVHAGPVSSTAMLITDPSHAVPIQVNRTGLRGLAVDTGSAGRLDIPYIPNNADLETGDLLVTSGLGGRFPAGYPVAEIVDVTNNPGEPYATVEARPLARIDRVREVLLLWSDEFEQRTDDPDGPATDETGEDS